MKHLFIILLLCVLSPIVKGQDTISNKVQSNLAGKKRADTIVKKSGEVLVVMLTEVNPVDVCYKLYSYQDGPVFRLPKPEIRFIFYGNGLKESYENFTLPAGNNTDLTIQSDGWKYYYKGLLISESDMLDVASKQKDKRIDIFISRTEKRKLWQYCFLVGGGLVLLDGLYLIGSSRVSGRYRHNSGYNPATAAQTAQIGRYMVLGGLGCGAVAIYLRFARRHNAHLVMDLYNKTVFQR